MNGVRNAIPFTFLKIKRLVINTMKYVQDLCTHIYKTFLKNDEKNTKWMEMNTIFMSWKMQYFKDVNSFEIYLQMQYNVINCIIFPYKLTSWFLNAYGNVKDLQPPMKY